MSETFQSPHADPDQLSKEFKLLDEAGLLEVAEEILPMFLDCWPQGAVYDMPGTHLHPGVFDLPGGTPLIADLALTRTPISMFEASADNPAGINRVEVGISEFSNDRRLAAGMFALAYAFAQEDDWVDPNNFSFDELFAWKRREYGMTIVDGDVSFEETVNYELREGAGDVIWTSQQLSPRAIKKGTATQIYLSKGLPITMTRHEAATLLYASHALHDDIKAKEEQD